MNWKVATATQIMVYIEDQADLTFDAQIISYDKTAWMNKFLTREFELILREASPQSLLAMRDKARMQRDVLVG